MNGRTALGAGFVLLAVLAGALFLDRAQRLVPVYAAARDLPAGTPLRSGDGAKFQPITIAPDESQFVQSQQFNVSTICRIYGVPPEAMGGQTAGHEAYTSPEMRATDLLLWSIRPWLLRVERAVSGLLPSTQQAKFNAGGMVRATLRDRYEAHKVAIEAGFLTVNEVRELEDRPPLPPPEGAVA